jgi:hypothetical protein
VTEWPVSEAVELVNGPQDGQVVVVAREPTADGPPPTIVHDRQVYDRLDRDSPEEQWRYRLRKATR